MRHTVNAFFRRAAVRRAAVLLAAVAMLVWAVPGSASTSQRTPAAATGSEKLVLPLTLPDASALSTYVKRVYTRGSGAYHHFLTPAAFVRRFGASDREIGGVLARLRGLGLTGATVASDHLFVSVTEPARSAHITTSLKGALGGLVSGVILPAQMPVQTPQLTTRTTGRARAAQTTPHRTAKELVGVDGGATPCIAAVASGAYTAPQLATGYGFDGMYAAGYHGEGMTAAVVEYGGYHSGNIAAFDNCYGVHTPVSRVLVDGGSGAPANGSEGEVTLDIEVLNELAPDLADIDVYEAPNSGTGELDLFDAFVTQDRAQVLSDSWGECEQSASQSYEALLGAITEQAAAQGQQIFIAAGDSGSQGCRSEPAPAGKSLSAGTEGALPWMTVVGGTDLSQDSTRSGTTVHREDVWNDGDGAGGGGESVAWAMPSWQSSYLAATGDHPDGLANDCGAPAGDFCRMEPDISFDADGEEGGGDPKLWGVPPGPTPAQFTTVGDKGSPGYAIYCASSDCYYGHGSPWQPVGGTSAATPLAAAAAVLWDQEAKHDGVSVGFLNPSFYAIASDPTDYARDFYDVTSGSNDDQYTELNCLDGCGSKLYSAGVGYDMATGLGSVNVANFADDLMSSVGAITLAPSVVHMYGYTGGGPATTAAVSVTEPTHAGTDAVYTASSDASWLVLDASTATVSGSLAWHVDPTGLAPGTYTGAITVTAADASTATLTVTYTVTPPAKIALLTRSLHFSEHQVLPFGAKHIKVCTAPLWADEMEVAGTLPGAEDLSVVGDRAPGTHLALRFRNGGAAGSVLHYAVDQVNLSWAGNDADPDGNRHAVQRTPEQPLVPSEGALSSGAGAGIQLASFANENTLGGFPSLQQGTYHGTIVIGDLADPADTATVPVTLTLGDGKGTPRIGVDKGSIAVAAAPGQTKVVDLGLTDPGGACGYGYSLSTDAGWLASAATRRSGTTTPHSTWQVPLIVTVAPTMAPGVYHATVTVASLNAANTRVQVPVTLTVS